MADFDVDEFLARPLVARVATNGPTIRPVWFLWEDSAFWWLTGPWSRLASRLGEDPAVALAVDSCDLTTGEVRQVLAQGDAELMPYDADRAVRKLSRYLGTDTAQWDTERFGPAPSTVAGSDQRGFIRLAPTRMTARDLSFTPSGRL